MSLFVEACKDHVKTKKRSDESETAKKPQSTFDLREAIKKQKIALEKDMGEEMKRKENQNLMEFLDKPEYYNFLMSLLEYCRELFRLENKQQVLEQEAKSRGLDVPQVLPSEKKKLNEKAIRMANAYARIVFMNKSIGKKAQDECRSYMQFKSKIVANERSDENFYEALMLFSAKCLTETFDTSELTKLEEEISRLFRSNAFNITERKIQEDELLKKYPQLNEQKQSDSFDEITKRLQLRQRIPKEQLRPHFQKQKGDIRPMYSKLNPLGATHSRSPMVSLIFPSLKDKTKMFQEESKKKQGQRAQSSFNVPTREMERIITRETKRRNPNEWKF